MISEYDLINKYFNRPVKNTSLIKYGIGDDAAIVNLSQDQHLIFSMDTLIEDVHFPALTTAKDIGYKSLAVNLSDMAAMGARPYWATLSLTLPGLDHNWLEGFSAGFFELADLYTIDLVGGDICQGPLSITVQIHGLMNSDMAVKRDGASSEELIYVTGTLGDAGMALKFIKNEFNINQRDQEFLLNRLNRPTPRVVAGQTLTGIATSMIDISDGLLIDLDHILQASHVGAVINPDLLPLSNEFKNNMNEKSLEIALTGGDDYELCFTIPSYKQEEIETKLKTICVITCIGKTNAGKGLKIINTAGEELNPEDWGYQHFFA